MGSCLRAAVVVLAVSLLFGNTKCLIDCAAGPCGASSHCPDPPPCHRHHAPPGDVSHKCAAPVTAHRAVASPAHAVPHLEAEAAALLPRFVPDSRMQRQTAGIESPSPPGQRLLSTAVLRI